MPIVPNLIDRLIFFHLNQGPAPLLDLFGALAFRTVQAAVTLGLVDALSEGPLPPDELARRIGADVRGTTVLLEALEPLGYVSRTDGRYANTAMTARWLVRSSPTTVAAGYDFWGATLPQLWGNLEESITSGQPPVNLYEWIEDQPEASEAFQTWMIATARLGAGEILGKLKLPAGARRLLDVGGGHATYSIELCRKYPDLAATVVDSPQALKAARANVAAENMGDRIELREGDFWKDDLGSGYDVALLFNIIHAFSPEQNTELFRRVRAALNPGGFVVILEQLAGKVPGPTARAINAIFQLNYFHLLGGSIYSFDEIAGWLADAGFTTPRRVNLLKAPGSALVLATRPAG